MTREEAIKRLNVWLKCANCPEDKQCYDKYLHTICEDYDYREEVSIEEAVNMAIKALEQEPYKAEMQEKIDKAIEEMNRLADHKIRPISFDQSVAIDMCIDILKKHIDMSKS